MPHFLVLAGESKSNFPKIKGATQYHANSTIIKTGKESFNDTLNIVSPDFFKIFFF